MNEKQFTSEYTPHSYEALLIQEKHPADENEPIRVTGLTTPSPFLNSGYHFRSNLDVTLYPYNPANTRRINGVTVHLLSRGVDEIGGSMNTSHDQTYITASEYTEEVYKKETRTDSSFPDKSILAVANRLLYRFREAAKE